MPKAEGSPAGPLCRYCGGPIPKSTGVVHFGDSRDYVTLDGAFVQSTAKPRTKEEAQRHTNATILRCTSVSEDGEIFIKKVSTWDGVSYADEHFCKGECAQLLGRLFAKSGMSSSLYEAAVRARDEQGTAGGSDAT